MKIAVLCGGISNERDVSISSGTGIARALRQRGHKVALLDLFFGYTKPYRDPAEVFTAQDVDSQFSVKEAAPDINALLSAKSGASRIGDNVLEICSAADIVFMALHGEDGENGKVQAMFDLHGVRYTGSGYLGSAIAMNKALSKVLMQRAGIPVPGGSTFYRSLGITEQPAFPCVVKPCSGGSSVGTTIVRSAEQLQDAVSLAFRYDDSVLCEEFISGREITVGVLDGCAMPAVEITPHSGFYDYKNKYQPGAALEVCPAPLTPEQTRTVGRLAELAHSALHVDVYSRADFILDADGQFTCLEVNTLPGMTPTSLIPQMAREMDMDYGELCEKIMEISLRKYA